MPSGESLALAASNWVQVAAKSPNVPLAAGGATPTTSSEGWPTIPPQRSSAEALLGAACDPTLRPSLLAAAAQQINARLAAEAGA